MGMRLAPWSSSCITVFDRISMSLDGRIHPNVWGCRILAEPDTTIARVSRAIYALALKPIQRIVNACGRAGPDVPRPWANSYTLNSGFPFVAFRQSDRSSHSPTVGLHSLS